MGLVYGTSEGSEATGKEPSMEPEECLVEIVDAEVTFANLERGAGALGLFREERKPCRLIALPADPLECRAQRRKIGGG